MFKPSLALSVACVRKVNRWKVSVFSAICCRESTERNCCLSGITTSSDIIIRTFISFRKMEESGSIYFHILLTFLILCFTRVLVATTTPANAGSYINSQTRVYIATDIVLRRLSVGKLSECEWCFTISDVPLHMMNDRRDTADIRIPWDCRWEPTACFFFMCTFDVMRWRESEREKEKKYHY